MLLFSEQWVELHGDRAGYDDPALVTGIGKMDNMSFHRTPEREKYQRKYLSQFRHANSSWVG